VPRVRQKWREPLAFKGPHQWEVLQGMSWWSIGASRPSRSATAIATIS